MQVFVRNKLTEDLQNWCEGVSDIKNKTCGTHGKVLGKTKE
jgi:hypothetical protein